MFWLPLGNVAIWVVLLDVAVFCWGERSPALFWLSLGNVAIWVVLAR